MPPPPSSTGRPHFPKGPSSATKVDWGNPLKVVVGTAEVVSNKNTKNIVNNPRIILFITQVLLHYHNYSLPEYSY